MTDVSFLDVCAVGGITEVDGEKQFNFANGSFVLEFNSLVAPARIHILPKPGSYKHEIYGMVRVSVASNQEFADNFNNEIYQKRVPIDLEHETMLSGAVGYYSSGSANVEPDGSVSIGVDWEDRGAKALSEGRFKYFSPAWLDKWTEPLSGKVYHNVLIGGALTTSPFFKDQHLRPLFASELKSMGVGPTVSQVHKDGPMETTKKKPTAADDAEDKADGGVDEDTEKDASLPPPQDDAKVDPKAKQPKAASEIKESTVGDTVEVVDPKLFSDMQRQFADMQTQLKTANDTILRQEMSNRARMFSDVVGGSRSPDSKAFSGDVDVQKRVLDAIYTFEGGNINEEGSLFSDYVALQASLTEQIEKSDVTKNFGGAGSTKVSGNPVKAFNEAVNTIRAANPNISINDAYAQVASENPELFNAQRKASYASSSDDE